MDEKAEHQRGGFKMNELPECPKCKSNANVVKYPSFFRCSYCEEIIIGNPGQKELKDWGVK